MSASPPIVAEKLVQQLRMLCSRPSHPGQSAELGSTAEMVAGLLYGLGMRVRMVATPAAPVIIGWRSGRSPRTLLLYHHYDVAPPGPWRSWSNEPYALAERDDTLFGRGVAHGKGPLVAHVQALQTLIQTEGDLPCGVIMVVEGAALSGSPHLAETLAPYRDDLGADICLASAGDRDGEGRPFCYSGSKGLLQVRLAAHGAAHPLPSGFSPSIRNPAWRLAWALSSIKGEDEDIHISGFYDSVDGPTREENTLLRQIQLDEAGRLEAWGVDEFLFGLGGAALVRAEVTLPTCNLASFTSEPASELAGIPASASACLELQLVPSQQPETIFQLLCNHLNDRSFTDIVVDLLPGGYLPVRLPGSHPQMDLIAQAARPIYGAPLTVLPLGPFTAPLHILAEQSGGAAAAVGLASHSSLLRGPDEQIPLDHLLRHGQLLTSLAHALAGRPI